MERMDRDMPFLLQYEHVAWFEKGKVRILDRRVYPTEVRFVVCTDYHEVVQAIADMVTQSAGPYTAVGMGMALAAWQVRDKGAAEQNAFLKQAAYDLAHARPTTANRYGQITYRCAEVAQAVLDLRDAHRERSHIVRALLLAGVAGLVVAALVGAVTGALLGSLILVRGLVTPGSVSWTWDTPFHYSALAHIRDSGDASSMSLGMLGDPRSEVTFYPAGWFDIASLIPQSTGASIPVAANATAGATAALVWPLACVFLARQVFGRRPAPLAVIGVLSMGFSQFPWELFSWGALWPYSLGQALMPISLGLVLSLTGKAADDAVGPARASVLLIVAVAALGFAHPAAVFGLGVLALFPVGWAVAEWVARQHRAGRTRRAVLVVGGVAVVVAAGVAGAASTSMVDSMRATNWPPTHTAAAAFGEILLNATNSDRALWVLSAVMVVGAVVFWRTRELRWIVVAHLGSGLFYIATASIQSTLTKSVTAFWFNDSHRLAAMLAVTAPLMTAAGAVWIAELAGRSAWFAAALERLSALRFRPANLAVIAPVLLVVLALMGTTKGLYQGRHALVLRDIHQPTREHTGKLRFYRQLEHDVPPDAVVANNPEDGSPLIWAVAHRRVMLPHLTANDSPDRAYLAHTLTHAARDPRACR